MIIKNQKQYREVRLKCREYLGSLSQVETGARRHDKIVLINEMALAIANYKVLESGLITEFRIRSLTDIPQVLINGRIASGFTQASFAAKMGIQEGIIQRYEQGDYGSIGFERAAQFIDSLPVTVLLAQVNASFTDVVVSLYNHGIGRRLLLQRLLPAAINWRSWTPEHGTSSLAPTLLDIADVYFPFQAYAIMRRLKTQYRPSSSKHSNVGHTEKLISQYKSITANMIAGALHPLSENRLPYQRTLKVMATQILFDPEDNATALEKSIDALIDAALREGKIIVPTYIEDNQHDGVACFGMGERIALGGGRADVHFVPWDDISLERGWVRGLRTALQEKIVPNFDTHFLETNDDVDTRAIPLLMTKSIMRHIDIWKLTDIQRACVFVAMEGKRAVVDAPLREAIALAHSALDSTAEHRDPEADDDVPVARGEEGVPIVRSEERAASTQARPKKRSSRRAGRKRTGHLGERKRKTGSES
jgi:transcriptional regulator with XRE-family HTH domain